MTPRTLVLIPAALKSAAEIKMKKFITKTPHTVFTIPLYPVGTTVFTTPSHYVCCIQLNEKQKRRLEFLTRDVTQVKIYHYDLDSEPDSYQFMLDYFDLMTRKTPVP